jgi:hypothetical protein
MVLKKKNICLSDGINITVKELSALSRLKIQGLEKINNWDIYRECIEEIDLVKLENIGSNDDDLKLIIRTINDLNEKQKEEVIDLKKNTT